jgi:hypothetical protein
MSDQIRNFSSGNGHAKVVFVIGRALKGRISTEERTIFGDDSNFDVFIGPQIRLFIFSNFSCNPIEKQLIAGKLLS